MIYLSCIVAAVCIIAFFLDPLKRYGEKRKGSNSAAELSGLQLLSATFRQMKKPNLQLLIPITIFIGMEQAFIGADFTQAYVACALGVHQIGFVMICFGVVNALCSILFGSVMKYIGRLPIIILGAVVHFTLISVMLFWRPNPDNPLIFFAMSGLWGVGDAVWQTQINGLYGLLFRRNKEAAFSNYRLWESAGFVIAYAYATTLCTKMKLYILLAVLTLGCIGYVIVEILYRKKVSQSSNTLSLSPSLPLCYPASLFIACLSFSLSFLSNLQQRKVKKQEKLEAAEKEKEAAIAAAAAAAAAEARAGLNDGVEETDDELDDLEEDIVVTRL